MNNSASSFYCPNCGAPLEYQRGDNPVVRCTYCSTSVIVPESLRDSRPNMPVGEVQSGDVFSLQGISSLVGQAARFKQVMSLLQAGNRAEAAGLYRELTGASQAEADQALNALQAGRPIALTAGSTSGDMSYSINTGEKAESSIPDGRNNRYLTTLLVVVVAIILITTVITVIAGAAAPLFFVQMFKGVIPTSSEDSVVDITSTLMPGFLPEYLTPGPTATPGYLDMQFGAEGIGPGLFVGARTIALDERGNLYAGEWDNGRIQRFDELGNYLSEWNIGEDKYLEALAASRDGTVIAVYRGDIWLYNGETGELIDTVAGSGGEFFESIALTPDGGYVALDGGDTLVRFDSAWNELWRIDEIVSGVTGDSELSSEVAVDGLGNIYIIGSFNNAVLKYNSQGKYINRWGSDGSEPGQFQAPNAIAVDGSGRVYVSDIKGIQIFETDGRYVAMLEVPGVVFGMDFSDAGELYVVSNANLVMKLIPNGK